MKVVLDKLESLDNEIRNSDNIDVYTKVGLLSQIEEIVEEIQLIQERLYDDGR